MKFPMLGLLQLTLSFLHSSSSLSTSLLSSFNNQQSLVVDCSRSVPLRVPGKCVYSGKRKPDGTQSQSTRLHFACHSWVPGRSRWVHTDMAPEPLHPSVSSITVFLLSPEPIFSNSLLNVSSSFPYLVFGWPLSLKLEPLGVIGTTNG